MTMPLPVLYSSSLRLHGELCSSDWSLLAPAAFLTRPDPTSAFSHLEGTGPGSFRESKGHAGAPFGFATMPSAPIAYFSMTVPRFVGSDSLTWNPRVIPVGIGLAREPLPLAVVPALCTW